MVGSGLAYLVCMRYSIIAVLSMLLVSSPVIAGGPKKGTPPGQAKKGVSPSPAKNGVPPGLAKKGGIPPGLAKKFGTRVPLVAYIAIDPRRSDRAWFLIGDKWTHKTGFDALLQREVRDLLNRPRVTSPTPLPRTRDPLFVISFR